MTWLLPVLAMVVIALVAGLLTGRISGSGLADPESTLPVRGLPDGGVGPADVRVVRFNAALRGYRMSEVDRALERLAAELAQRDEEIARLRGEPDGADDPDAPADPGTAFDPASEPVPSAGQD